jgi:hypothetical protein
MASKRPSPVLLLITGQKGNVVLYLFDVDEGQKVSIKGRTTGWAGRCCRRIAIAAVRFATPMHE